MFGFMVVRFESVTDGTAALRMFGNVGAPACPGDRLMLFCCRLARSVVLFADRMAFANARNGTRSKNRPALPRTTVWVEAAGAQAKPARGARLFLSVWMVCRNCRS